MPCSNVAATRLRQISNWVCLWTLAASSLRPGILRALNVQSMALITNNPDKVIALQEAGVRVARRIASPVTANPHNLSYLQTKRDKLGHELTLN